MFPRICSRKQAPKNTAAGVAHGDIATTSITNSKRQRSVCAAPGTSRLTRQQRLESGLQISISLSSGSFLKCKASLPLFVPFIGFWNGGSATAGERDSHRLGLACKVITRLRQYHKGRRVPREHLRIDRAIPNVCVASVLQILFVIAHTRYNTCQR